jgi:protein-L-isoaspartate(D-aspartate) O-methyltransferase
MNFETARAQMLDQQIRAWEVLDSRVLQVMRETPREHFVPPHYRELAFADTEIPLDHEQSMMTPKIEGRLLQSLRISPIDEALEIGTGSGYLGACLARLAERVVSVDIFADFTTAARDKFAALDLRNAELRTADAFALAETSRYDVIAVTGSVPAMAEQFVRMLRPGGRLFIVVGKAPAMEARLVTMHPGGDWTEESMFETVLTPLINVSYTEPFVL